MASKALGAGASRRPAWATDVVWSVSHAVNDGYPSLYLALLPVLMLRWHFNAGQAGLLTGLVALSTQALQPVMGWWADRRGGPWFIVGGLLIGSLGASFGLASPLRTPCSPPRSWWVAWALGFSSPHGGSGDARRPHPTGTADERMDGQRYGGPRLGAFGGGPALALGRQLGIGSSGRSRADRGRLALRFGTRIAPAHTASRAVFGQIVEYSPTTRPAILFGGGVAQSGNSQSAHAAAHSVA